MQSRPVKSETSVGGSNHAAALSQNPELFPWATQELAGAVLKQLCRFVV